MDIDVNINVKKLAGWKCRDNIPYKFIQVYKKKLGESIAMVEQNKQYKILHKSQDLNNMPLMHKKGAKQDSASSQPS
jgi:hypothetical protein